MLLVAVLVTHFGTGPVLAGLRTVQASTLAAAVAVSAVATVCAAVRWRAVAIGLGVPVGLRQAVPAYYAAGFLNSTLPGGVLGDVHRGLQQGRAGHPLRCLRAVVWERTLGQVIQVALTAAVVLSVPSPFRPTSPVPLALTALGVALLAGLLVLVLRHPGRTGSSRLPRSVAVDLRSILGPPGAARTIAVASLGSVACHVAVFLLAARSVDPGLALVPLLPVALVVLFVGALPVNVAGWGPREGAAAWAFGAAGLGAAQGISVSVTYGVLALAAAMPGAVALLAQHWQARRG